MNWGKGIALFMSAFIIFILVLAIKLMTTDVDLESEDYYAKEMKFSDEMEAIQNAIDQENQMLISAENKHLVVQIPESIQKVDKIELHLIRLDDDKLDRTYKIEHTRTFVLDKKELVKGVYRTELRYVVGGKNFLQKDEIYI